MNVTQAGCTTHDPKGKPRLCANIVQMLVGLAGSTNLLTRALNDLADLPELYSMERWTLLGTIIP